MLRWAVISSGARADAAAPPDCSERDPWWGDAQVLEHNGSLRRAYRIGDLARAVGRSPGTIRRWEAAGVLPRCPYRTGTVNDPRGQRRAYPATYAEAVAEIAEEERIIGRKIADFSKTKFVERVKAIPSSW